MCQCACLGSKHSKHAATNPYQASPHVSEEKHTTSTSQHIKTSQLAANMKSRPQVHMQEHQNAIKPLQLNPGTSAPPKLTPAPCKPHAPDP